MDSVVAHLHLLKKAEQVMEQHPAQEQGEMVLQILVVALEGVVLHQAVFVEMEQQAALVLLLSRNL